MEGTTNSTDALAFYPVGSVYITTSSESPETLFGGEWSEISKGLTLVGAGSYTDKNGDTASNCLENDNKRYSEYMWISPPEHTHIMNEYNFVQSPAFSFYGRTDDGGASADPVTTSGFWRTSRKNNDFGGSGSDDYMYFHYRDRHTHTMNSAGGSTATGWLTKTGPKHNNVQPFEVVHIWKRVQ